MGLPIVTADLDLAWDAAERIANLLASRHLWESRIERGKVVLADLPTPSDRYRQYVACVSKLVEQGRR